mmetsp:Transcript_22115/g.32964  ORF Transcript_22115/g.32964 Transcript_22115/m.32964 type:complete len:569 (-) Transcript_22115:87-1793(-)
MESVTSWWSSSTQAAREGINSFWEKNEDKINETKDKMKAQADAVAKEVEKVAAVAKEKVGENLQGVGDAAKSMFSFISGIVTSSTSPEDLGISYINDHLIAMGFPHASASHLGSPLDNMSTYLNTKHPGKYMIFNLSERSYDTKKFHQQVMEFKFPGYPSPPLGTLLSILTSMHSWLDADPANVVVVHCLTGKGRTALIIASYLLWIGRYKTAKKAISIVADKRRIPQSRLIIPSQLRYLAYFARVMEGVELNQSPLKLTSIRTNSMPTSLVTGQKLTLEIYENGRLVHRGEKDYLEGKGDMNFKIGVNIEGDILVRLQTFPVVKETPATSEVKKSNEKEEVLKKISVFRFAFHTGFHDPKLLTLTKREVDLASTSTTFDPGFKVFIDLEAGVTNYGKPAKGKLNPKYWKAIMKGADGPKEAEKKEVKKSEKQEILVVDKGDSVEKNLDKTEAKETVPKSSGSTEIVQDKEPTAKETKEKRVENKSRAERKISILKSADDDDEDVAIAKENLAALVKDLDEDIDEDGDDEVDEETTKALLKQIAEDDEDDDEDGVAFEVIKKLDAEIE